LAKSGIGRATVTGILTKELSLKSAIVSSVMLHFVAIIDWASRAVFSWHISNAADASEPRRNPTKTHLQFEHELAADWARFLKRLQIAVKRDHTRLRWKFYSGLGCRRGTFVPLG
jgi:hypothetical protein